MKKVLAVALLVFPNMVLSELPILVDQETGKYLENLGTSSNDQYSASNPFDRKNNQHLLDGFTKRNNPIARYGEQYLRDSYSKRNSPVRQARNLFGRHERQHLKDGLNKRNNPIARHGEQFLRDSMNNRNNLVRRYGTIDDRNDIVNNPFYATHGPVSMRTLYSW